jgi:predicted transcriptional regulator
MRKDKKQLILLFLKKHGYSSTSKIANNIKSNHYHALGLLKELLKENQITQDRYPKRTYWSLK